MTRRASGWLLPLRPRFLAPAIALIILTFPLVVVWPDALIFVGEQNRSPRAIGPFEYAPIVVAIALALGLAPRLPQWDRYGSVRTRWLAAGCAVAVVAVPVGVFFAALGLYPSLARPPARTLVPIVSNVAIASLLAVILLGTLGRMLGVVIWGAVLYATMFAQSLAPAWGGYLPLTNAVRPDLSHDLNVRWWWILALTAVAAFVVAVRRSVPIRISLRAPEDS